MENDRTSSGRGSGVSGRGRVISGPGPGNRQTADPTHVARRVEAAARLREALFGPFGREPSTSAYRMIHADGDGLPGFAVDAYGGFLVVGVLEEPALARVSAMEGALDEVLHPRGIVRKLRWAERGRGRVEELVARGEKPPGIIVVLEDAIPLEVELLGSLHTGLFTDMREEHLRMRDLAARRRVLNTFAYTGAFSVAAALGGAAQVTSVDVVGKVLDRARRNFRLSGIEPARHHFARMEVLDFLGMACRRGWRYDAVVLDPPTFATFRTGTWALKGDYPELLDRALAVLEEKGLLWAAANTESLAPERFEEMVAEALRKAGREARTIAVSGLPPDYPTPPDRPEARYLKVRVLEVG